MLKWEIYFFDLREEGVVSRHFGGDLTHSKWFSSSFILFYKEFLNRRIEPPKWNQNNVCGRKRRKRRNKKKKKYRENILREITACISLLRFVIIAIVVVVLFFFFAIFISDTISHSAWFGKCFTFFTYFT